VTPHWRSCVRLSSRSDSRLRPARKRPGRSDDRSYSARTESLASPTRSTDFIPASKSRPGRGAAGNADYRDLIRTSLIVDANYLVLGMMLEYRSGGATMRSFERTRDQLDAIFGSERLKLPFEGVLLVGY
jgi:hypothetical protein